MPARVIAFPGVTLTAETERKAPARKAVTSVPCPFSAYPIQSDEYEGMFTCSRCGTNYHEPCFWHAPLEKWVAYWTWLSETTDEDKREDACTTCRQLEGPGK